MKNKINTSLQRLENGNFRISSLSQENEKIGNVRAVPVVSVIMCEIDANNQKTYGEDFYTASAVATNRKAIFMTLHISNFNVNNTISRAIIRFKEKQVSNDMFGAYQAETLDWTNQFTEGLQFDFTQIKEENNIRYRIIEISDMISKTINGHYYIAIAPTNESSSKTLKLYSDICTGYQPEVIIEYTPYASVHDNDSVLSSVNKAGNANVNIRNGKLTINKYITGVSNDVYPLNMNIIYNPDFASVTTIAGLSTYFPKGWKLFYQMYIYKYGNDYFYIDGNFNTWLFKKAINSNIVYYENSGSGMLLTIIKTNDVITGYEITLERNNIKLVFIIVNNIGILKRIQKKPYTGSAINVITINYDSANPTKITRVNGLLVSVTITYASGQIIFKTPTGNNITLNLFNNNIRSIDDLDGTTCNYSYDDENRLYKMIATPVNPQGNYTDNIVISYNDINRVTRVVETYEGYTRRSDLIYHYLHTIIEKRNSLITIDNNDIMYYDYRYNEEGKLVCSSENDSLDVISDSSDTASFISDDDYQRKSISNLGKKIFEANYSEANNKYVILNASFSSIIGATSNNQFELSASLIYEEYILQGSFDNIGLGVNDYDPVVSLCNGNTIVAQISFKAAIKGKQIRYCTFTLPLSITSLRVKVDIKYNGGVGAYNNICVYRVKKDISADCINQAINTSAFFTANGTSWYLLKDLDGIVYNNINLVGNKMLLRDFISNIENKNDVNNNSHNVWLNNKKLLITNVNSLILNYNQNTSINFYNDDVKIANIYYHNNEYILNTENYYSNILSNEISLYKYNTIQYELYVSKTLQYDKNYQITNKIIAKITNNIPQLVYNELYEYDNYGNMINNVKTDNNSLKSIKTSYEYTNNLAYLYKIKKYIENQVRSFTRVVDYETGYDRYTITPKNEQTNYSYESNDFQLKKISTTVSSIENNNQISYIYDRINSLKSAGNGYNFEYKNSGLNLIKLGTEILYTRNVTTNSKKDIEEIIYSNGYKIRQTYDKYGRVVKIEECINNNYTNRAIFIYSENKTEDMGDIDDPFSADNISLQKSPLKKVIDYIDNSVFTYEYNVLGQLENIKMSYEECNYDFGYIYDIKNRITQYSFIGNIYNDNNHITNYTYYDDGIHNDNIIKESNESSYDLQYHYWVKDEHDLLERLTKRTYAISNNTEVSIKKLIETITYFPSTGNGNTTNIVASLKQEKQVNNSTPIELSTQYLTYDENNRITSVVDKLGSTINSSKTYEYDSLGRIVRENNSETLSTVIYTYDNNGNIITKTKYGYNNLDNVINTKTYSYTRQQTQLSSIVTSYGSGTTPTTLLMTYDNLGNVISIGNKNLTFQGRLLKQYDSVTYKYNSSDNRYEKNSTISNNRYYYEGNKLVKEERDNQSSTSIICYIYTHAGLTGFNYNYNLYYYRFDSFGNVIEIYRHSDGLRVGKYIYDAWGIPYMIESINGIASMNPFRYKGKYGYYYDIETGLYLVSSRYYNPEWGRFISPADVSALNPQSINGLNLYSYAGNNPINCKYGSSYAQNQLVSGLTSNYVANNSTNTSGNLSNILGAFSAFSDAFGMFDMWSDYISSGLSGGVEFFGPKCFGFKSMSKYSAGLKKFSIGMIVTGSILDFGMSTYGNFHNNNYSTGQAIGATFMDAGYYTLKGLGTYFAGELVGSTALSAGIAVSAGTLFALGGWGVALGVGVAVGISVAGAVTIYYIGEALDYGYEWLKEQIFN